MPPGTGGCCSETLSDLRYHATPLDRLCCYDEPAPPGQACAAIGSERNVMGQWLVTIRKRVLGHHREAPEEPPREYDLQEPATLVINLHPTPYSRPERPAGSQLDVLWAMPAQPPT